MWPDIRRTLPVVLALVMLPAAALACSIEVQEARIENARLFEDAAHTDGTRTYDSDQTFYANAELRGADAEGVAITIIWRAVDVGADHAAYDIAQEEITTTNGPLDFALAPPDEGWPPGDYALVYALAGKEKLTVDFSVRGRR